MLGPQALGSNIQIHSHRQPLHRLSWSVLLLCKGRTRGLLRAGAWSVTGELFGHLQVGARGQDEWGAMFGSSMSRSGVNTSKVRIVKGATGASSQTILLNVV